MAKFFAELEAPTGSKIEDVKSKVGALFASQEEISLVDVTSNRGGKKTSDEVVAPPNNKYVELLENQLSQAQEMVKLLLEKLPASVAASVKEVVEKVAPDQESLRAMVTTFTAQTVPNILQAAMQQMMGGMGNRRGPAQPAGFPPPAPAPAPSAAAPMPQAPPTAPIEEHQPQSPAPAPAPAPIPTRRPVPAARVPSNGNQ